jgi:acetyl-CoA synthetase
LGLDVVILDEYGHLANKGEVFIIPPSIGLSTELLNKDHHKVYFANTPHQHDTEFTDARIKDGSDLSGYRCLTSVLCLPLPLRRHGDQMERLPNGYYRAHGRVDDTMNLGGIKVSSAQIEQALNTVEDICETAAIAISPSEGGPSQLVIYVVVVSDSHKNEEALKADLQKAIAQRLNPLFKIRDLVLVDTLPRTASNKVMRRVLRDQYRLQSLISQKTN